MKHIFKIYALALLCLGLGSCSVEEMIDNPGDVEETGTLAYISPTTKTYHRGLETYFQENDKIALYKVSDINKDSSPVVYTVCAISDEDGSAMLVGPKLKANEHYTAMYPYVEGKTLKDAKDYILENQHQIGRYGTTNLGNTDILIATTISAESKTLEFSHDVALIHICITASRVTSFDGVSVRGGWGDRVYYLGLSSINNSSDVVDAYIAVPSTPDYFEDIYVTYYKNGEAIPYKYTMPRLISISTGQILKIDLTTDSWANRTAKFLPHYDCSGVKNGHEYVEVGGQKWACSNVGAMFPWEYGGYYAWGGSQDKGNNYNTGSSVLTGNSDTATKLWGSSWRMPTQSELQALLDDCEAAWRKFSVSSDIIGKSFFDNSEINVFLPAAGIGGHHQGDVGFYWSSTPGTYNGAYYLWFESDDQEMHYDYRGDCYSVRAVLAE